jgi:hypothetical protein
MHLAIDALAKSPPTPKLKSVTPLSKNVAMAVGGMTWTPLR